MSNLELLETLIEDHAVLRSLRAQGDDEDWALLVNALCSLIDRVRKDRPEPTTMKQMAADALLSQSAPNLGAITRKFGAHLATLQRMAHDEKLGDNWAWEHPISVLFATQIYFLARTRNGDMDTYENAHRAVTQLEEK